MAIGVWGPLLYPKVKQVLLHTHLWQSPNAFPKTRPLIYVRVDFSCKVFALKRVKRSVSTAPDNRRDLGDLGSMRRSEEAHNGDRRLWL